MKLISEALVLILLGSLCGCSNLAAPTAGGSTTSQESLLTASSSTSPVIAQVASRGISEVTFRRKRVLCEDAGGTWKMPSIGKDLIAQIQYGPNNCPPKFKVDLQSTDQTDGFVVPQGFTFVSALTLAVGDKNHVMTWQGSGLTGTLTSKFISSSKSYYLFLYDSSNTVLSEQELSAPNGQMLTFTSPFQNGFNYNYSSEGDDLTLEFDTPSN